MMDDQKSIQRDRESQLKAARLHARLLRDAMIFAPSADVSKRLAEADKLIRQLSEDRGSPPSPSPSPSSSAREPTRTEIDAYKVYMAVERHLMQEGDQSKVLQTHIHDAAKSLLDSVISRDEIGVSEDYEIPPRREAFIRAFRRGRDGLAR